MSSVRSIQTVELKNITNPPTTNNTNLINAFIEQETIGWKNFINGFITPSWRQAHTQHLETKRSQKSALLFMSRLQTKIWMIAWDLWEHRNKFHHNKRYSIQPIEENEINNEIIEEWWTGIDNLPPRHNYLFNVSLQNNLKSKIHSKISWLASIWTARDLKAKQEGTTPRERGKHATNIFNRWRERIQPTAEEE